MLYRAFNTNDAARRGFRDGFFVVLRGGRYGAAPAKIRKGIGSLDTDRRERHGDMERFGADVDRVAPTVIER